jgi:hypothetical protein
MHQVADIGVGQVSLLSSVRFTDCDFAFGVIPPINRWANIIRQLRGLVEHYRALVATSARTISATCFTGFARFFVPTVLEFR